MAGAGSSEPGGQSQTDHLFAEWPAQVTGTLCTLIYSPKRNVIIGPMS